MNDERKPDNAEFDLEFSSEELDAFSLASEDENVRSNLRSLGARHALMQDPAWQALAQGTATKAQEEALQKQAAESNDARDLLDIVGTPAKPGLAKTTSSRQKWFGAAATTLALAAGATLFWTFKSSTNVAMPEYALSMNVTTTNDLRSENEPPPATTTKVPILRAGSGERIRISVQPKTVPLKTTMLEARAFVERLGTLTSVPLPLVIDESGTFVAEGTRDQLFPTLRDGSYELWVVIGAKGQIPTNFDTMVHASSSQTRSWSISRTLLQIEGAHPTLNSPPLLEVLYSGCSEIMAAHEAGPQVPECQLAAPGKIRLHVRAAPETVLTGQSFGRKLDLDTTAATSGKGMVIEVDVAASNGGISAGLISITAQNNRGQAGFVLPVASVPTNDRYTEARNAAIEGKSNAAQAALDLSNDPDLGIRARAHRLLGVMALQNNQLTHAVDAMEQAIAYDRASGRLLGELNDRAMLAHILGVNMHQTQKSLAVFDDIAPILAHVPTALVDVPRYRADTEKLVGNLRQALIHYEQAIGASQSLGLTNEAAEAKLMAAEALARLGRIEEARSMVEQSAEPLRQQGENAKPCKWVEVETQHGWVEYVGLVSANAGLMRAQAKNPTEFFQAALGRPCKDALARANLRTNLALVALLEKQPEQVRLQMEEARAMLPHPGPYLEDWWQLLDIRATLLERPLQRTKIQEAITKLEALYRQTGEADVQFDARLAIAEAHELLGHVKEARIAYADADSELLHFGAQIAIGSGASSFLAAHEVSTTRRIEFLLRQAQDKPSQATELLKEAVLAARQSRARVLASVLHGQTTNQAEKNEFANTTLEKSDQLRAAEDKMIALRKEGKETTAEEYRRLQEKARQTLDVLYQAQLRHVTQVLANPGEDELLLVYYPLTEGYVGFAVDSQGIEAKRLVFSALQGRSPEQRTELLLEPFREAIGRAKRIRLAPHGVALANLDFHALPWDGASFITAKPIAYGVDVGVPRGTPTREGSRPTMRRTAILIGDTENNLDGAKAEVHNVEKLLEGGSFAVETPDMQAVEALSKLEKVLMAPDVQLFHFAGHARYAESPAKSTEFSFVRGDLDGWQSALRMGQGTLLSSGTILGFTRVPEWVILSGCETAQATDKHGGSGLGLAQAFIAKGSRAVVATSVPVKDETALKIMNGLYRSEAFPSDLAAALRDAIQQSTMPEDWAAFRVLVP